MPDPTSVQFENQLASRIRLIAGISRCEVLSDGTLATWAESVSEPGKAPQILLKGAKVYVKDAPLHIFGSIGYQVARGDDVNLAVNFLVAHGWPEWEKMKAGRFVDMGKTAQIYRAGQQLRTRYLAGDRHVLPQMIQNMVALWDSYYETYPPQVGNARIAATFLSLDREVTDRLIRWYIERGYGHGAPHAFCLNANTKEYFWVNGGGEKYRPKPWMTEIELAFRPRILLLRLNASSTKTISADGTPHAVLADALIARNLNQIRHIVQQNQRAFFEDGRQERCCDQNGGLLDHHYTQWVDVVTRLRQIGRDDAAAVLLMALLPIIERTEQGQVVPPWYYDQLCIIHRKAKDYAKEIEITKRCMAVRPHDPHLATALAKAQANLMKASKLKG